MSKVLFYVGGCNRAVSYFATSNATGIAAFRLDTETGSVETLGVTGGIDNPTFLAVAPDGKSLTATSEVLGWNEGTISSYAIDPSSGTLSYLNNQPTRGDIAAHLSYDASGRFVASVNYAVLPITEKPNKAVTVYPRAADGSLGAPVAEMTHQGSGKDPARQERPHAHCVRWTPDNRFLVVAALGIDQLVIYAFDPATGALIPHHTAQLPPGSGPRHFAFHPSAPFAYSVNELGSTVASFAFDASAGRLALLSLEASVPPAALGHNHCSAIKVAPGGRHLFVGNRGHDSIGVFEIDSSSGVASLKQTVAAGGKTPRDLEFDPTGALLAVANQDSDCISFFRYDAASGALTPFGKLVAVGTPTAISFRQLS